MHHNACHAIRRLVFSRGAAVVPYGTPWDLVTRRLRFAQCVRIRRLGSVPLDMNSKQCYRLYNGAVLLSYVSNKVCEARTRPA